MRVLAAATAALMLLTPSSQATTSAPPAGTPPAGLPPQGVSTPAASPAVSNAFGVDVATPQGPGSALNSTTIALVGVGWVRIAADWSALEPAQGKFAWASLDAAIRQAAAAGAHVVVMLENTPRWAALTPDAPPLVWSHQPPKHLAHWTAFVKAAATRYRGRVAAWQIEPSLDLTAFRGTSTDYREMLHAARGAVRAVDPEALVVAASPGGLDLPYLKAMVSRAADDFDAVMLYPRGRTPEELLEALGVIRSRILTGTRHQLWLTALPGWGAEPRMAVAALAGGVSREFWPALDPQLSTVIRLLGRSRLVGPINRGPGVYAYVFASERASVAVAWSAGPTQSVRLATAGAPTAIGPTGQLVPPGPPAAGSDEPTLPVGPDPVFVTNPAPAVVEEATRTAQQGPFQVPRDPDHDFSKAESVSATLGATNTERGLYNQRLRALPSGAVVPVAVDGAEAVRTDQPKDAVYVYFDVDHSFLFYNDGRYDLLITIEVHQASAPERVGFNVFYDSMTGYRFTRWQWIDAGQGWAKYTVRITDASFSSTWGWDFAVNGAGDKKENLVVRAVTVRKVRAGSP